MVRFCFLIFGHHESFFLPEKTIKSTVPNRIAIPIIIQGFLAILIIYISNLVGNGKVILSDGKK